MKILDEYPGRHHYWQEFKKTDYHCPQCGAQEAWQDQGLGDYYLGVQWLCTACSATWTMQGPTRNIEINDMEKLTQLRQGKTFEPTTKPGR